MHFPLLAHKPNSINVIRLESSPKIDSHYIRSSHFTCSAYGGNEGSYFHVELQFLGWGLRIVTSMSDSRLTTVCCHVAGGVSIEPDKKTIRSVFSYALGANTTRKFG